MRERERKAKEDPPIKIIMSQPVSQGREGPKGREGRQNSSHPQNVRVRKLSLASSAVQVIGCQLAEKVRTKELVLQLPVPEDVGDIGDPINVKVIEEDYYRKYKPDSGIKSLLRAYEETRKKNSSECMTRLGLDIIKIKSFSKNNDMVS